MSDISVVLDPVHAADSGEYMCVGRRSSWEMHYFGIVVENMQTYDSFKAQA